MSNVRFCQDLRLLVAAASRKLAEAIFGPDMKLTKEILRHANARITMELYAQSTMPAKQAPQARLVSKWNRGDDETRTRDLCRDSLA